MLEGRGDGKQGGQSGGHDSGPGKSRVVAEAVRMGSVSEVRPPGPADGFGVGVRKRKQGCAQRFLA